MELQGLTLCARLARRVVEALPIMLHRVTFAGDSMCCLMAAKKDGCSFSSFFQNRLAETEENLGAIRDMVGELLPLKKVHTDLNPADLCTRVSTKAGELGEGSLWQNGPPFLVKPYTEWPLSEPDEEGHIPEHELKKPAKVAAVDMPHPVEVIVRHVATLSNRLSKVVGILARYIHATLTGKREEVRRHPTWQERERAERVLLHYFGLENQNLMEGKELHHLRPEKIRGLWCTRGRLHHSRIHEIAGWSHLPIVQGDSRLGELYALQFHEEDHRRDVPNVLARVRRRVWLLKGRAAVRKVSLACTWCRRRVLQPQQQLMGPLPPEVGQQASPFAACCLDLFGPMMAKGIGGHSRKLFKTWGVLFSCLGSKAISIWLAPGYSAAAFNTAFQKQCAIYGQPKLIISDKGSQLTSSGRELAEWDQLGEKVAASGTEWRYTPTAFPWRNGAAERSIALAKHSLLHVSNKYEILSFVELEAALLKAAEVVNRRPLSARIYSEYEFYPVTPSDLLLGRMGGFSTKVQLPDGTEEEPNEFLLRADRIEKFTNFFWQQWGEQGFELLCPRIKWKREFRALAEGDIVLLKSDPKLGGPKYRLGRVQQLLPGDDGVVRTVMLGLRSRRGRSREAIDSNKAPLESVRMAVQRIVVLVPSEEQ